GDRRLLLHHLRRERHRALTVEAPRAAGPAATEDDVERLALEHPRARCFGGIDVEPPVPAVGAVEDAPVTAAARKTQARGLYLEVIDQRHDIDLGLPGTERVVDRGLNQKDALRLALPDRRRHDRKRAAVR